MTIVLDMPIADKQATQADVDAAWRAEFRKRIADADSGRVQWLDSDEVDADILAELAEMNRRK